MARAAAFLYDERGKAQAMWEADSHLGSPALSSGPAPLALVCASI